MMKRNNKYTLLYFSASCHDETYNVRYLGSDNPLRPFTPVMHYNTVYEENEWHHIVLTFDGVVEKIYVDGVLDNSRVMDLASAVDKARFIIGASDGRGENYSGYMASLRMYDYTLSDTRVNT